MLNRFVAAPRALLLAEVAEEPGWKDLGHRMRDRAQATCPVGDGDGPHLADSIEVVFIGGADPRILIGSKQQTVGDSPVSKLWLVTDGTDPHPIDAKGDYSLHNAVTDEYFGPHVDHPGTAPNPFVLDAIRSVLQES